MHASGVIQLSQPFEASAIAPTMPFQTTKEPTCPGTPTEYCGNTSTDDDTGAISVFKRVISEIVRPVPTQLTDWTYVGCFSAQTWLNARIQAGDSYIEPGDAVNANSCSITCANTNGGYRYAGLINARCICINVAVDASLWVGDGQCDEPGSTNAEQACGGFSGYPVFESLVTLYTRRATPSAPPPAVGAAGPQGTYNWGCYLGGAYLLDTLLTGFQISSLTDVTPDMDGAKCVATCLNQKYTCALIVGGLCFCNTDPPPYDLSVDAQERCNNAYPNHPSERCGCEVLDGG